jgi:hypothetical protein
MALDGSDHGLVAYDEASQKVMHTYTKKKMMIAKLIGIAV